MRSNIAAAMRRWIRADRPRRGRREPFGPRRHISAAVLVLSLAGNRSVHATDIGSFTLRTPDGPVLVDRIAAEADGPHPGVVVLSGSKGFRSSAYAEMNRRFNRAGLDVFELHALTNADVDEIARAGSASARIAYYATRLPRWTAAVHALVDRLNAEPRNANRVCVLGISLGAQIAAAAVADRGDVRALVLVDGGFPDGETTQARVMPSLMLIWGGADRVFPPKVGRKLAADVQSRGGRAVLKIYEGGSHDFFVQPGTARAAKAQTGAATFLADQLK